MNKRVFKVEKGQELIAKGSNEKFYKIKLVRDGEEINISNPYVAEYSAEKLDNGQHIFHYLVEQDNKLVQGQINFDSANVKVILDDNKYKLSICNSKSDNECITLPKASLALYRSGELKHLHYAEVEDMLTETKTPYSLKQYYGDNDSLTLALEKGYAIIKEKDGEMLCLLYSYAPLLNEKGETIAFNFTHNNIYDYWVRASQYVTQEKGEYGNNYYFSDKDANPVGVSGSVDSDLKKYDFYKSSLYNTSLENAIKDYEEVDIKLLETLKTKEKDCEKADIKLLETLKSCQEKLKTKENEHKATLDQLTEQLAAKEADLEACNSSNTSNYSYLITGISVPQCTVVTSNSDNPYNYYTSEVAQYSGNLYQCPCIHN